MAKGAAAAEGTAAVTQGVKVKVSQTKAELAKRKQEEDQILGKHWMTKWW